MPFKLSFVALAFCLLSFVQAGAAEPASPSPEEQAIRAAAQQYIDALSHGDFKTMLGMWTADGDIVDEHGQSVPAKEYIEREAAARTSTEGGSPAATGKPATVTGSGIRFLTPGVAIEDGHVTVDRGANLPPAEGRFTAIWVKQDNAWKLASLREVPLATTRAADLAALDWMVGHWTGQGGKASFDVTTHWNDKHTFLVRELTVMHDGKVILSGKQRIGVDPLDGKIKSWMHDTDGGHGEGLWTRHGNSWVVQANGVSPDGRRTTGTNVYTYDGGDTSTWKSLGATSNGQPIGDFEITLHRVANAGTTQ